MIGFSALLPCAAFILLQGSAEPRVGGSVTVYAAGHGSSDAPDEVSVQRCLAQRMTHLCARSEAAGTPSCASWHSQQRRRMRHPGHAGGGAADGPTPRHKRATAVLLKPHLRPDEARESYFLLVLRRNHAIALSPWAHHVDHLVFYEDIGERATPQEHLDYIQNRSRIALTFIPVAPTFQQGECWNDALLSSLPDPKLARGENGGEGGGVGRVCGRTVLSDAFRAGYKSMCWFWFSEFLHHVPLGYEEVLRIDDDCVLIGEPYLKDALRAAAPHHFGTGIGGGGGGGDSSGGGGGGGPEWPVVPEGTPLASVEDEDMDRDEVRLASYKKA